MDSEDELLRLRLLVAAHAGGGGHRDIQPTTDALLEHFLWDGAREDVSSFCKSCLHCLLTASGEVVPRPMGHTLHAEKPNRILHFDYCYIGMSSSGEVYILILKDDFSSYVWLLPCRATDAKSTVESLLKWFSAFGTVRHWVSDRGSHFKNELVKELHDQTKGSHHFTLAYCP